MKTQVAPFNIVPSRPPGMIFTRRPSGIIQIEGKVVAVVRDFASGRIKDTLETRNIVNDQGDLFYAYRATDAQPTTALFTNGSVKTFDGIMELYKSVSAAPSKGAVRSGLTAGVLITGSAKVMDTGYPKRNDTDTDNTGKGTDVVTYKVSYLTSEANDSTIDDVIITNPSPSTGDNLLMWADGLGSFTKTSSDTLVVYVNHTMNGT